MEYKEKYIKYFDHHSGNFCIPVEDFTSEVQKDTFEFLKEKIFVPGEVCLTYLHYDRQIFGGVTPKDEPLEIVLSKKSASSLMFSRNRTSPSWTSGQ